MDNELAFTVFGYVALRVAIIASVAGTLYYMSRQHLRVARLPALTWLRPNTKSTHPRSL